jgi:outer membrane protein assembly factor BamE
MWFNRIKFLLILPCLSVCLGGCWFIYKPDIVQGNVLSVQKISLLHAGMTRAQVVEILGNPILVNVFADNQMIYVYTIQPGHGAFKAQQLRVFFDNGHVTHYTSTVQ